MATVFLLTRHHLGGSFFGEGDSPMLAWRSFVRGKHKYAKSPLCAFFGTIWKHQRTFENRAAGSNVQKLFH